MAFKPKKKINVGIIGGAGYAGSELIKILTFHPKVNLQFVTSTRYKGVKVSSIHRFLGGVTELEFIEPEIESFPEDTDLIFFSTPHGVSMGMIPELLKVMPHIKIIDLSGDFRLRNPSVYKQYYGKEHNAPDLLKKFIYGLPELNRDALSRASHVANPGCFATGIIFALYPLVKAQVLNRDFSVVSVTGSSGSGESPKEITHHPIRAKNFKAYRILEHQHTPEIEQFFKEKFSNFNCEMAFVPCSGPFVRGIFTTVTAYNPDITQGVIEDAFYESYGKNKFIRIVPDTPEITMVYASNYVEVSFLYKRNFIVTMSAIDNLVRGASGQAVQNMNIMLGFEEDEGLNYPGMIP